jgi:hypothetical protein
VRGGGAGGTAGRDGGAGGRGRSDVAVGPAVGPAVGVAVAARRGGACVVLPAAAAGVDSGRNEPVESAEGKPTGGEDGAGLAAMRAATSP